MHGNEEKPSLEKLIESEDIGIESLHPGGLEITRELAELCKINKESLVLDVASGTGESACFLAAAFGCKVTGVDASDAMVGRAVNKAARRGLPVEFLKADALQLPFQENSFEIVISECTTCLLDKQRALSEMVRVTKAGGYVGIHDLCWKGPVPEEIMKRLAEIEGERPETLEGWKALFTGAGLVEVITVNKSHLTPQWSHEVEKRIGIESRLKILFRIIGKWGVRGLRTVLEAEEIYKSEFMGYGIIVGRKPLKSV